MRTLTAPILAALAAPNVALAQLVRIWMPRNNYAFPGNVAIQSEAFDNAAWTLFESASIVANSTVSPTGLTVADALVASVAQDGVHQIVLGADDTTYTVSVFAKAGTLSLFQFGITNQDESATGYTTFDLSTGVVGTPSGLFSNLSAGMEYHGNGWWRCFVTGTSPSAGEAGFGTLPYMPSFGPGKTRIGMFPRLLTSGHVHLWGGQIEQGTLTDYKPTVGSAVYGDMITLATANCNIPSGGLIYKGAYGLGTISQIDDSPGEVKGLTFQMVGSASSSISLALDGANQWQGCVIEIFTCLLSSDYQVVDAILEWSGFGDTLSIEETSSGTILNATAESSAVDLLRGSILTISNADQQVLYPSDRAFEYITSQVDKPVIWPSKEYFQK
ncbi:hypothetical protein UFOVP1254_96 [uncultured Caudovirales phage]|uniref:Uncharacterized protein n=1 Tax=uncultured Caudovirales phage TaxID=2100421 RepID=A0A6J5RLM7_9CAUD|nr:hypothetical protein UFOVP1254_96 [uncultured Caudovirales phage]